MGKGRPQREGSSFLRMLDGPGGVGRAKIRVRFRGLLQALWINKCKPGTHFLSLFQGFPAHGTGFPLDTLGPGVRAADESWTWPLVGMALLIYVRVGTPLVDSQTWHC